LIISNLKKEKMETLDASEVMKLIDRVGPSLGYDNTYTPTFPPGRSDVCVVVRLAENGASYGFDTVYVVWIENGQMKFKEIKNTRNSKDYISINSVKISPNGNLEVNFGSAGLFSGSPWSESVKISFSKK
jgi:hypothetical protein